MAAVLSVPPARVESPVSEIVTLPSGAARVEWRRNARARRVSLRIDPGGGAVIVTLPPRTSRKAGMALLMGHADWVARRLADLPPAIPLTDGTEVPIGGVDTLNFSGLFCASSTKSFMVLTGNSARTFTGLMVMADAINRAGSTDPEAIRKALVATDLPASKLIMPWKGVKFDETGQNVHGSGILVQIVDGKYHTVWPFNVASREIVWPMPAWDKRK